MRKILFVDRDGTILVEPEDQQIDSLDKLEFVPGAIPALKVLREGGWELILVSNQDGLGTPSFPTESFEKPNTFMLKVLESCGIIFTQLLICPHFADEDCLCRKPKTGLLRDILSEGFNRSQSAVIGDRQSDLVLAEAIGVKGLRIGADFSWQNVLAELLGRPRTATISRKTKETAIQIALNLDSSEAPKVDTGHAFFDHMLEQIGYHGGVALTINVDGDWQVDDHHVVEDTAIALGQALRQALGDCHGIARYGFLLPMDESLAEIGLDLSGRAFCKYEAPFTRELINGLATEMVPHFFRSLAEGLKASLHIKVRGENNHHLIEASFKGFARCLAQAIQVSGTRVPSSKGQL